MAFERYTEEEDKIIKDFYPSADSDYIMKLLPERDWISIKSRAKYLKIHRKRPSKYKLTGESYGFSGEQRKKYERKVIPTYKKNYTYKIDGTITYVIVKASIGSYFNVIIDTEDLPKLTTFGKIFIHDRGNTFYARVNGGGKSLSLHRVITSCPEDKVVDHINHNGLDNRKSNLRICTNAENSQNLVSSTKKNHSCGIRGVSWNKEKQKWRAYIRLNRKFVHLGWFDNISSAKKEAEMARAKYMPFSLEALGEEVVNQI